MSNAQLSGFLYDIIHLLTHGYLWLCHSTGFQFLPYSFYVQLQNLKKKNIP